MNSPEDSEWIAWNKVQKAATQVGLIEGDLRAAIAILDQFLTGDPSTEVQRELIAFRGTLYEDHGDLSNARSNFIAALKLADEGFVRFELEDALAEVNRRMGRLGEAKKWYLAALCSGAADPRVADGEFLLRLSKFLSDRGLNGEERALAEKMVVQGWRLLHIQGEPDLADIEGAAIHLINAQRSLGE